MYNIHFYENKTMRFPLDWMVREHLVEQVAWRIWSEGAAIREKSFRVRGHSLYKNTLRRKCVHGQLKEGKGGEARWARGEQAGNAAGKVCGAHITCSLTGQRKMFGLLICYRKHLENAKQGIDITCSFLKSKESVKAGSVELRGPVR